MFYSYTLDCLSLSRIVYTKPTLVCMYIAKTELKCIGTVIMTQCLYQMQVKVYSAVHLKVLHLAVSQVYCLPAIRPGSGSMVLQL